MILVQTRDIGGAETRLAHHLSLSIQLAKGRDDLELEVLDLCRVAHRELSSGRREAMASSSECRELQERGEIGGQREEELLGLHGVPRRQQTATVLVPVPCGVGKKNVEEQSSCCNERICVLAYEFQVEEEQKQTLNTFGNHVQSLLSSSVGLFNLQD